MIDTLLKKEILKLHFRLATHLRDINKIIPKIKYLKKLGYDIAVNLMQIDKVEKDNLLKF